MQNEPFAEWQRLTELYGKMYDAELLNLTADSVDLTETARQVLRDEMKKRGLDETRSAGNQSRGPLDDDEAQQEGDQPSEYTWKTPLCECEDTDQAWQISEVLRRAGIESWIERPGAKHAVVWDERMVGNLEVLVAADQLDQAREIAARPVPQDVIDQSKMTEPEFESPRCPNCRAADPVLEGVDPVNTWRCEACGKEWIESAAGA